jgi:ribosomal protein L11 methyltransferase
MTEDSNKPRYPRVVLELSPDRADELSAELFELGAEGVEERDDSTLEKSITPGKVLLIASFAQESVAREAMALLPPEHGARYEELVGDEWRDAWKRNFHAFELTRRVLICPPWEQPQPRPDQVVLILEPGRAFGTGLHATTALVSESLDRHQDLLRGAEVLDVGCGTGILALIALLLGAAKARGVDNDPEAVRTAIENAEANALSLRFEADTTDVAQVRTQYPVVVANIEARVLIPMAGSLRATVAPGGLLVLSGVLAEQAADVERAYGAFRLEAVHARDEWVAIELRRA